MKYNEIERLQQLAGIITEIKVNKPIIDYDGWIFPIFAQFTLLDQGGWGGNKPMRQYKTIMKKYGNDYDYYNMEKKWFDTELNPSDKYKLYKELDNIAKGEGIIVEPNSILPITHVDNEDEDLENMDDELFNED